MAQRVRRLAQEGAKFTAVNAVATLLALLVFNVLTHGIGGWFAGSMHALPELSYLIANCLGMVVSYLGTRHYVFKHRKPMGPAAGAVNYAVVNLASFIIPMACLGVSRHILHLDDALSDNISGNVVGSLAGAVFRFWAFRRFVFRAESTPAIQHPQHARGWWGGSATPEVGPAEPELVEHQPQQRDADPDHIVRITGHP
ncbi:MAG: GtrA family protein [Marmoricola sp.]